MAAGDAVDDDAHRGGVSPSTAVALQVDAVEQVVETTLEHEE